MKRLDEQEDLPWLLRGYPMTTENRPFCWIRMKAPGGPLGIPPETWARVLSCTRRMHQCVEKGLPLDFTELLLDLPA